MIGKFRKGFLQRSQLGFSRMPNQLLPSMKPSRAQPLSYLKPKWNWTVLDEQNMNLTIEFPQFQTALASLSWLDDLRALAMWHPLSNHPSRGTLMIRTLLDDGTFHRIAFRLVPSLSPRLSSLHMVTHTSHSLPDVAGAILKADHVKLSLELAHEQLSSPSTVQTSVTSIGSVLFDSLVPAQNLNPDEGFVKCRVVESRHMDDSPYQLIRLCWPVELACMPIPLGHHVILRMKDQAGCFISRPYTPVSNDLTFNDCRSDLASTTSLCLLVKIYPNGQMSQLIGRLKPEDEVEISTPMGSVTPNFLTRTPASVASTGGCQQIVSAVFMLAAGSGITPMLRPIELLLLCDENSFEHPAPTVHLICFDRTPANQVLVKQLDELCQRFPQRFSVLRVLSDSTPHELRNDCVTGTVSDSICRAGLLTLQLANKDPTAIKNQALWLICGPPGFNNAAVAIAKHWGVCDQHIIQFGG